MNLSQAETSFKELLKFLLLHKFLPGHYTPSRTVDNVWHTFLLFTRSYQTFCEQFIGNFIHHEPGTDSENEKFAYEEQYSKTIQALKLVYGSADKTYWPHGITIEDASCGSCESLND